MLSWPKYKQLWPRVIFKIIIIINVVSTMADSYLHAASTGGGEVAVKVRYPCGWNIINRPTRTAMPKPFTANK